MNKLENTLDELLRMVEETIEKLNSSDKSKKKKENTKDVHA